jgi:hypothetical protein
MITRSTMKTALLILAAGAAQGLADPPVYHVTDMEPVLTSMFPDEMYLSSDSRGLNENGDCVGEVNLDNGIQHSWVFTFEHGLILLPLVPGAPATQAMDISDRDENGEVIIVGGSVHGVHDYNISSVIWRYSTVTGEVLETRDVGNLSGYDEGLLVAVNNNGIAVGHQGEWTYQTVIKYNVFTDELEELEFPNHPLDINNLNQIVGGSYIGDLDGNYWQLDTPPDCTGYGLKGINDLGWVVGNAGRPYSDGNGRRLASWVRHTDAGWLVPSPGSPWDTGFEINNLGDITIGYGPGWDAGFYVDATGGEYSTYSLLPPEISWRYNIDYAYGLNDNQQIAASSHHAVLLTPTGRMIIPGDVNGDVEVNHDDHCAWSASPIDLDGDGDADADDEQWLIARLAVFGYIVQDCNLNGVNDHCDITSGLSDDCNGNDIPDECEDDCDDNGIPDECESDCNGNGIPDACDIANGTVEDCNGNGIPDECDGANTVVAGVVYDPPMGLYPDVHFTDSVLLTEVGTIADVDFKINDHFRIGTTTIRISHAGVTVTVIDRPGLGPNDPKGFVNGGYDVTLDDQGSGPNIQTVGEDCCNFEYIESPPSYKPNEPLSAFNGLPREGVWTMEFLGGYPQHYDPKLLSWSVLVTDEEVDPGQCCGADFNGDGAVNTQDVLAFLNAWVAGDASADFNGDGLVDTLDVLAFLNAWSAGC